MEGHGHDDGGGDDNDDNDAGKLEKVVDLNLTATSEDYEVYNNTVFCCDYGYELVSANERTIKRKWYTKRQLGTHLGSISANRGAIEDDGHCRATGGTLFDPPDDDWNDDWNGDTFLIISEAQSARLPCPADASDTGMYMIVDAGNVSAITTTDVHNSRVFLDADRPDKAFTLRLDWESEPVFSSRLELDTTHEKELQAKYSLFTQPDDGLSDSDDYACVAASTGACLEGGAVDSDCCATCGNAGCAAGYTYMGQVPYSTNTQSDWYGSCETMYCGNTYSAETSENPP